MGVYSEVQVDGAYCRGASGLSAKTPLRCALHRELGGDEERESSGGVAACADWPPD